MLKKISLIGILVFSFGAVYSSTKAPTIAVEDEPRASSPSRLVNHMIEDVVWDEKKQGYSTSFSSWHAGQALVEYSSIVDGSQEEFRSFSVQFRELLEANHPQIGEVLENLRRSKFFSIVVDEEGDLDSVVESLESGQLVRIAEDGLLASEDAVPAIISLLRCRGVQQAVMLDLAETFLKGDLSPFTTGIPLSSISFLSLNYCNLGDKEENIPLLEEMMGSSHHLAHLGIAGNHLGNKGAQMVGRVLAADNKLMSLSLGDNDIGPEGAHFIASGLQDNETLVLLGLSFNPVRDGIYKFVEGLETNSVLQHVYLIGCEITPFLYSDLQEKANRGDVPKTLVMEEKRRELPQVESASLSVESDQARRRRLSSALYA